MWTPMSIKRAAALLFLIDEHAPAGDAATPEGVGAGVVDLADLAVLDKALDRLRHRVEAVVERHHQLFAGAVGGIDHRLAFHAVQSDGLFNQDMLAGFERVDGGLLVQEVGGADGDRVDLGIGQHLLIVGVLVRHGELLRRRLRGLGVGVGHGDDLHEAFVLKLLVSRQMRVLRDSAAADNPDADRGVHTT